MSSQEQPIVSQQSITVNRPHNENEADNGDAINSNDENIRKEQLDPFKQKDQTMRNRSSEPEVDSQTHSSEIDNKKRSHTKQLIERYFYQLTIGCANLQCTNENCASNVHFEVLTPNQAAARAIKLFSEEAEFCNFLPSRTASCFSEGSKSNTETIPVNSQIGRSHR